MTQDFIPDLVLILVSISFLCYGMTDLSNNDPKSIPKSTPKSAHRVHRFVSNDFAVRMASVNATEVVARMQQ